jgi:acyl carrier protein
VGIAGDLYIGGQGVSPGYWGRPELTAERFIPDPFNKGEKIYRTGDVAKWLPDGNIEFAGRQDHQVKIRGYRIELEEISNCLETYDGIKEAVVILRGEDEDKFLVAYYTADKEPDPMDLRKYLSGKLPDPMLPSFFVPLSSMPMTPNGKLDRKALPDPEIRTDAEHVTPSNEIEETLAGTWAEVLKLKKEVISTTKTFFELGGNSLKIMQLNMMVNEALHLELSTLQILRYPTISSLAKFITEGEDDPMKYKEEVKEEVAGMQDLINIID